MCKANGKQWNDYFRTERAQQYLQALARSTGIPVDLLAESITTGPNEERGTWVHRQAALDLSRWISAPFAVWMDAAFLERMSQVRDTQPVLAPAFSTGLEAAKLLADAVGYVGGDAKTSMARSLTALAKAHPEQKELCYESQRLLCPAIEEFVNVTTLTEELKQAIGEQNIKLLTTAAKEEGLMKAANPRNLVNVLLTEAGLQFKGGKRRDQASYIPTEEGSKFSREETRPDIHSREAWVPQLLWLKDATVKELVQFVTKKFKVA
ncbi:MAG: hypothetical protein CMN32_12245 [Saprospirales bacterium]|nr:hypothetical protein [Saprospirales bacterium]